MAEYELEWNIFQVLKRREYISAKNTLMHALHAYTAVRRKCDIRHCTHLPTTRNISPVAPRTEINVLAPSHLTPGDMNTMCYVNNARKSIAVVIG